MLSIASTSRMRGTLRTITSSSVRSDEARIGSAPFLFPAGTIVPESGTPPSMTNFSMSCARRRRPHGGAFASRLASVTAICTVKFEPRAHYPARGLPRSHRHLDGLACTARGTPSASAFCNSACSPIATYFALACGFAASLRCVHTFASAPSERPPTFYEQMFAHAKTSKLAQRTLGALRLTRSFLIARGRLRRRLGGRPGRAPDADTSAPSAAARAREALAPRARASRRRVGPTRPHLSVADRSDASSPAEQSRERRRCAQPATSPSHH